jgi:adenosylhomocysteine nucleosidase
LLTPETGGTSHWKPAIVSAPMIAITFALPEESREFRRAIGAVRGTDDMWRAEVENERVLIAHCGVGPAAAGKRIESLLGNDRPRMLIATGFAGALEPSLALGDLMLASNFSDPEMLAKAQRIAPHAAVGAMTSAALPVETAAAKSALAGASGAIAVDMETNVLAAACSRAGVPLLAVRAISDRAGEFLPVPFAVWFDLERQRPRPSALLGYLATHPIQIPAFARFVRGLAPARRALAEFLVGFIRSMGEGKTSD